MAETSAGHIFSSIPPDALGLVFMGLMLILLAAIVAIHLCFTCYDSVWNAHCSERRGDRQRRMSIEYQ